MSYLVVLIIFIVSALPLHFAVKFVGGKTYFLKSLVIVILTGFIASAITIFFPFANLIIFLVLIWIYHEVFRLKWIKAFLVLILQAIFMFILAVILVFFFSFNLLFNFF